MRCAISLLTCASELPRHSTGIPLRALSVQFGVSLATAQRIVLHTCSVIIDTLRNDHIRWPNHAQHVAHAERVEESHAGLPHVAGFVDGTHIPIVPQDARDRVYSYCRKGFHSIVLQGICDKDGRFLNTNVGSYGRVHDARVFCTSPIVARIADVPERESYLREPLVLLGDAAYPCTGWLVTPYPTEHTPQHARFNKVHSSARMAVERAFGKLKLQWAILHRNKMYGPRAMVRMTTAACILHNITIDVDEEHGWQPPPDALLALLVPDDPEPPEGGLLPQGPRYPRNSADAGKLKRNMMCVGVV